jgi:hypothetical protein
MVDLHRGDNTESHEENSLNSIGADKRKIGGRYWRQRIQEVDADEEESAVKTGLLSRLALNVFKYLTPVIESCL